MLIASVHVNFRPLSGNWDGQNWDQQEARCSNNFLSGPTPPVAPGGATAILWQVVGPSDPDSIVFNVSVDLPDSDEVLFTGVRNGTATSYLPTPTIDARGQDGTPFHQEHRWDQYYSRGIYIASVFGASAPFTVNVVTAPAIEVTGRNVFGAHTVIGGSAPFTINVSGAGDPHSGPATSGEPTKPR
jgi:hypothetical protein